MLRSADLAVGPFDAFEACVSEAIDLFPRTRMVGLVREGKVATHHYIMLLKTIFHQTRQAPYSFAQAAARCDWDYPQAKEYLLDHAREEKTHWRWVLDDLSAIGYRGPDPRTLPPHPTTQAFIALNFHLAETEPLARLATAAVLEGIGPRFSSELGGKLLSGLGVDASAASFFISHGDTDKKHWKELLEVIGSLDLTPRQWMAMNLAADMAGRLYRAMYDHEGYQ